MDRCKNALGLNRKWWSGLKRDGMVCINATDYTFALNDSYRLDYNYTIVEVIEHTEDSKPSQKTELQYLSKRAPVCESFMRVELSPELFANLILGKSQLFITNSTCNATFFETFYRIRVIYTNYGHGMLNFIIIAYIIDMPPGSPQNSEQKGKK